MGPLVIPGVSSCLACSGYLDGDNYYLKNDNEIEDFANHFKSPSFSCLNSLISCMASYEIVKYLLKFGECISVNNTIQINPLDFTIKKIQCLRSSKCKTCNSL